MKNIARVALALCLTFAAAASDLTVDSGSYLNPTPNVTWWGAAVYLNDQGNPGVGVALSGSVGIWSGSWLMDQMSDTVYGGEWFRERSFQTVGGECFTTTAAAQTFDLYREQFGSQLCVPRQNPYPPPPPVQTVENDQCTDPCTSPILLDLRSGEYRLSSAREGVLFDINADGALDRVAWPVAPDVVAFLFADRNGNNVPDDGSELFGDHALRADGAKAQNGFDALASFDANGDARITAGDPVWSRLRLWFDRNRDGVAHSDEVATLASTDVTILGTAVVWNRRRDAHGNVLLWKALFERNGAAHPFYDAYLTMTQ